MPSLPTRGPLLRHSHPSELGAPWHVGSWAGVPTVTLGGVLLTGRRGRGAPLDSRMPSHTLW